MPGPKSKYTIELTDREERELWHLVNSRKSPQGQVLHARIVLIAHEHPERSNLSIAPGG